MRNRYSTAVKPNFVEEISEPTTVLGRFGNSRKENLGIGRLPSANLSLTISHHQFSALVNLATAMPEFTPVMECYKAFISLRRKRH